MEGEEGGGGVSVCVCVHFTIFCLLFIRRQYLKQLSVSSVSA